MQPTTIARVLPVIAKATGLDAKRDRAQLLDEIHECRQLMYSGLGEPSRSTREAFFIYPECPVAVRFSNACRNNTCHPTANAYVGISLSDTVVKADVYTVDGCWIEVHSEYAADTRSLTCISPLIGIDLGDGYSLPVDPPAKMNLGFRYAGECDDIGDLRVGVEYRDLNGNVQREDIPLSEDVNFTKWAVASLEPRGITLPPGRRKMVELWADETILTKFHPSVDVPNYRRIALHPELCGKKIEVQDALHEPREAVFDTDFVETGDLNFWRNLIQWKELHFKTKRNTSEERAYGSTTQVLLQHAEQMLALKEPEITLTTIEPDLPHRDMIAHHRQLQRMGRGYGWLR